MTWSADHTGTSQAFRCTMVGAERRPDVAAAAHHDTAVAWSRVPAHLAMCGSTVWTEVEKSRAPATQPLETPSCLPWRSRQSVSPTSNAQPAVALGSSSVSLLTTGKGSRGCKYSASTGSQVIPLSFFSNARGRHARLYCGRHTQVRAPSRCKDGPSASATLVFFQSLDDMPSPAVLRLLAHR